MAVLRTIHCKECGKTKREARAGGDYSNMCHDCEKKAADQNRRAFLAGRAGLTVEERLAWIEAWIYDYRPPRNPLDTLYG